MTMWDFAAQHPDNFYLLGIVTLFVIMHIADSLISLHKSKHEKEGDDQ